jgi:hypothetical protein
MEIKTHPALTVCFCIMFFQKGASTFWHDALGLPGAFAPWNQKDVNKVCGSSISLAFLHFNPLTGAKTLL